MKCFTEWVYSTKNEALGDLFKSVKSAIGFGMPNFKNTQEAYLWLVSKKELVDLWKTMVREFSESVLKTSGLDSEEDYFNLLKELPSYKNLMKKLENQPIFEDLIFEKLVKGKLQTHQRNRATYVAREKMAERDRGGQLP